MAKTKKGTKRKFEVAICAWIDLLGYGSMLKDSQFDPTIDLSIEAIERLELFHKIASKHASRNFNIIALNDGLISTRNISPRTHKVTADFVTRTINLFKELNYKDKEKGYYGARCVIATGFRIRYSESLVTQSGIKEAIYRRLDDGTLNTTEAINMAMKARPYFGISPELQANFAFTKAYLIDSGGSKEGFGGPNCFIDLSIFSNPIPKFISFSEYINWSGSGLWGKFGKLDNYKLDEAHKLEYKGFLSAFEVGENITKTPAFSRL
ncbi:hypothetical protein [Chryseobacterium sp. Marseille-Q3244]|uniref:hypothetical protein n=1 Tax=Chryseobacterium sp. Marseille-Q3244 TaxID=2758092 RepID=UPI002024C66A|nr:hypothetical protein [Chryseobacterium sp. Marseille-Q3244]